MKEPQICRLIHPTHMTGGLQAETVNIQIIGRYNRILRHILTIWQNRCVHSFCWNDARHSDLMTCGKSGAIGDLMMSHG